jgi:hypothetical protein
MTGNTWKTGASTMRFAVFHKTLPTHLPFCHVFVTSLIAVPVISLRIGKAVLVLSISPRMATTLLEIPVIFMGPLLLVYLRFRKKWI